MGFLPLKHQRYITAILSSTIILLLLYFQNSLLVFNYGSYGFLSESSPCACHICVADRGNSNWFSERYDPNVPILLNSNNSVLSANVSRWWKELQSNAGNYTKVMDQLFSLFSDEEHYSDTSPDRCRTCAVVGNSGNLLGSNYGPLIDFHEFVIRTYVQVPSTIKANKDKVMILHPEFIRYVYDNWAEGHGRYPSTGFLTLIFALHICDEVSVFGFGATSDGIWHHYFDKTLTSYEIGVHAGKFENETINRLQQENKILIHMGWP
ncbi:CMP-N-acetylneuraminate-beta-galactosamide-alpha-2,3-sialyltransferase 2-like isoform X2 [Carassius carassius]|uniref:CMP-N-acetylneuraminate-beta-galactosamide- alpha-2,3-sialyltransferase 2-like isoform X2 n=1 Tax=Carassius carassius TaxID=217509 RepID=UPI0028694E80|nr:CMP-N-acetylneuraminate-beta-galactosamide-alpha-2,3-sialyltransferase 2-like isoform X2 [Carassius carassius]